MRGISSASWSNVHAHIRHFADRVHRKFRCRRRKPRFLALLRKGRASAVFHVVAISRSYVHATMPWQSPTCLRHGRRHLRPPVRPTPGINRHDPLGFFDFSFARVRFAYGCEPEASYQGPRIRSCAVLSVVCERGANTKDPTLPMAHDSSSAQAAKFLWISDRKVASRS